MKFNLRFPGQYYDEVTKQHYNHNRFYNPVLGRYVEPDCIGLEGGLNPYIYAGANPIKNVDPSGLYTTMWDTMQYIASGYNIGEYNIHNEKLQFVNNNRLEILALSKEYGLPAILLAGVAYNEYGGDPSIADYVAWTLRAGNKIFADTTGYGSSIGAIATDPGKTSVGDTSVQLRHFAGNSIISQAKALYEVNGMGQDATNKSLRNSAILLQKINNDLYPGNTGFSKQQMINILHMYNGPGKNTYGENIFRNSKDILGALK
uniref:RHS repeat-associated core domain-containing protein n=1 Tax=Acinetobacter oleivorans TaxID=1148157 RepID=UPI00298F418D|nr:RHS repeat-associated core domain-containing protein [Acinetobacter oleivorans]